LLLRSGLSYILGAVKQKMSENHATLQGTERYASRFKERIPEAHFRRRQNLLLSSIGFGTYLGEPDSQTDHSYEESLMAALRQGCNVIDTAINYRFQRSERNIGKAVETLIKSNELTREEVLICTKGGFLTFDGEYPVNPARYFQQEYIDKGICKKEDIVAGCHCMTSAYLENQLERSLQNLKIDCVDVYFIHNPETQLSEISRQDFLRRMLAAFKLLEKKVNDGKIRFYGTATWDGYRAPRGTPGYLSLEELIGLARNAGGEDHHFRALQFPFNLAMPEALVEKNQNFGSEPVSVLEAAERYGFIVSCSASILQGRLSGTLPEFMVKHFPDFRTNAQRSLQFVRSAPGVTSALVGMSQIAHVNENLEIAARPPVPSETFTRLFKA
jgi:aryl-alcohol dehydrogenase-like predicted oxidoreductase